MVGVTHVIIDKSVAIIKKVAFCGCGQILSVTMCDDVKKIESRAFYECYALEFMRLSKTLEFIGLEAFCGCNSMRALLIPPSVKSIEEGAFKKWSRLRLLKLPDAIDLSNLCDEIIDGKDVYENGRYAGVIDDFGA